MLQSHYKLNWQLRELSTSVLNADEVPCQIVSWLIARFRNRVPGCWNRVTRIRLYYIVFFLNSCLFIWPCYVIGQAIYIFILCFLLSFFLSSFFPRLISAVGDWMSTIHTLCGLSVNLQCRSETCCVRLTENIARKKSRKSRHLGTIPKLCPTISSQLRHVSTIGKNLVKQWYLLHDPHVLVIWWTSAH